MSEDLRGSLESTLELAAQLENEIDLLHNKIRALDEADDALVGALYRFKIEALGHTTAAVHGMTYLLSALPR